MLHANYRRCGARVCGQLLGRSASAVVKRAARLGLNAPLRPWTTDEERLLREFYERVGPAECAAMLERTPTSVWTRAYRPRLTTRDPRQAQRFNFRDRACLS